VLLDIILQPVPVPLVVPDLFAPGADGNQSRQYFYFSHCLINTFLEDQLPFFMNPGSEDTI